MKYHFAAAILGLMLASGASALQNVPPPVVATVSPAQPASVAPVTSPQVVMTPPVETVLRTGTPVVLRLLEGLSTKEKLARINDRVRMEVAEAVLVGGVAVVPVGSPVVGELTDVRNKGMWGRSGRIVGRVLSMNANGRTIRLSGTFDSKGGSGTVGAVAVSGLVFLPAGFFMTGKSASLPAGSTIRGFIDEDVPFSVMPKAAAPLIVPAAAVQPAVVQTITSPNATPSAAATPAVATPAASPVATDK